MNIKNLLYAALILLSVGNACAMRPGVTININRSYPAASAYYPTTTAYAPTYYYPTYYYPTYGYSYWPEWSYYDDYYWNYNDTAATTFVKACAVTGILALAFALIGAISNH